MKYLKIFIIFFLAFISGDSIASNVRTDLRCFTDSSSLTTKLEMMFYSDEKNNWSGGYVKYGKAKFPIPIVFQSSKEVYAEAGRPSYFETIWLEIATGEVTGKYTTGTQGANVYTLEYAGRKTNKKYSFNETVQRNAAEDGCKW